MVDAMTPTPRKVSPRTQAANEARTRKSQERAAERLNAAGWVCFPPELVAALREVIATHDELTGWVA